MSDLESLKRALELSRRETAQQTEESQKRAEKKAETSRNKARSIAKMHLPLWIKSIKLMLYQGLHSPVVFHFGYYQTKPGLLNCIFNPNLLWTGEYIWAGPEWIHCPQYSDAGLLPQIDLNIFFEDASYDYSKRTEEDLIFCSTYTQELTALLNGLSQISFKPYGSFGCQFEISWK